MWKEKSSASHQKHQAYRFYHATFSRTCPTIRDYRCRGLATTALPVIFSYVQNTSPTEQQNREDLFVSVVVLVRHPWRCLVISEAAGVTSFPLECYVGKHVPTFGCDEVGIIPLDSEKS